LLRAARQVFSCGAIIVMVNRSWTPSNGDAFRDFAAQAARLTGEDVDLDWLEGVWRDHGCDTEAAMGYLTECKLRHKLRSGSSSASDSSAGEANAAGVAASPLPAAAAAAENIQVIARFRPVSDAEAARDADLQVVEFGDDGQTCMLTVENREAEFAFNRVFEPMAAQDDVYETAARPIIHSVINGVNGAIIAYGQTGSGKTHTMMGPRGAQALIDGDFDDSELGLVPRALLELQAHARQSEGAVQLRVSYVEVYQERIIDLLSVVKPSSQRGRQIQKHKETGLWVSEVVETPVESAREALEIMRTGNKRRTKASTEMNQDSSRSHAIFIVTVTNATDATSQRFAQLYLADLAGSERVGKTHVSGKQLDEAKNINKSLLALSQVITNLSIGAKHVPYRDSKLTRLLQNCLGGNARTCIICTASPHPDNACESLSTLRFGARASKIRNETRTNIALDAKALKKELDKARAEIAELRRDNARLSLLAQPSGALVASDALAAPRRSPIEVSKVSFAEPTADFEATPLSAAPDSSQQILELIARRLFTRELMPSFICPITRAVMRDPVCATDGSTYERSAIERLARQAGRMPAMSPVTGRPLPSKQVIPNTVLKQLIASQLPNLPPLEARVSEFCTVSVYLLEHMLSFLNGRSLGNAQVACSDFLAVGSKPTLWAPLVVADFGIREAQDDPRQCYAATALRQFSTRTKSRPAPTSGGLRLLPAVG